MNTAAELKTFHYAFQITRTIIFEVSYYRLGSNKNKHYSTEASQFNRPKTDYNQCGQAQESLLKRFPLAYNFYLKYDPCHLHDISEETHTNILNDIEKLKEKYNYISTFNDNGFGFGSIRELSMMKLK